MIAETGTTVLLDMPPQAAPNTEPKRKLTPKQKREQMSAQTAAIPDKWGPPKIEPPPIASVATGTLDADGMPPPLWYPVRSRKDPYRTPCPDCPAMMMLPMPSVHCVKCHKVWTARILSMPVRCPDCGFNLHRWRALHGIAESQMTSILR